MNENSVYIHIHVSSSESGVERRPGRTGCRNTRTATVYGRRRKRGPLENLFVGRDSGEKTCGGKFLYYGFAWKGLNNEVLAPKCFGGALSRFLSVTSRTGFVSPCDGTRVVTLHSHLYILSVANCMFHEVCRMHGGSFQTNTVKVDSLTLLLFPTI